MPPKTLSDTYNLGGITIPTGGAIPKTKKNNNHLTTDPGQTTRASRAPKPNRIHPRRVKRGQRGNERNRKAERKQWHLIVPSFKKDTEGKRNAGQSKLGTIHTGHLLCFMFCRNEHTVRRRDSE